jgi:hypothetical protein
MSFICEASVAIQMYLRPQMVLQQRGCRMTAKHMLMLNLKDVLRQADRRLK